MKNPSRRGLAQKQDFDKTEGEREELGAGGWGVTEVYCINVENGQEKVRKT